MNSKPSLRLWLAACGACAAATAQAQSPATPAIPPPRIEYPISKPVSSTAPPLVLPTKLAPVERIGEPIPKAEKLVAIPAPPAPAPAPSQTPTPAIVTETQWPAPVESLADVPCETGTVHATTGGKRTIHEKIEYTKSGNVRTCKYPATSPVAHGAVVRSIFERQRQLALAEYFVVYREDFLKDSAVLNDTGLRHLTGIYKRLDWIDDSILIEPTGSAKLDNLRRDAVIQALVQAGAEPGVSGRVGSGTTRAEGLRYQDVPSVGIRNPLASGNGFGGGLGGGGGGGFGGGLGGGGFGGGFR